MARVVGLLIDHGPALISVFSVNDEFKTIGTSSYIGANLISTGSDPALSRSRLHAMALVGHRTTARAVHDKNAP